MTGKDILNMKNGQSISKSDLFSLIQYSKVKDSDNWGGEEYYIRNTPQQGINWIGKHKILAVIIKSEKGKYIEDSHGKTYAFKARNGKVNKKEKANQAIINQPKDKYPLMYFIGDNNEYKLIGRFAVSQIFDKYVSLIPFNENILTEENNIIPIPDDKTLIAKSTGETGENHYKEPQNEIKKINAKIMKLKLKEKPLTYGNNEIVSSNMITQSIRDIILSINENCKLHKKKDIFDQAALFKIWGNIEKSCKSKSDFKGFAENIYKLLRETTRYINPNKKNKNDRHYIFLIPKNFIKKEPTKHFWDIVNTLRHYYVHDEIGNIANVYKELLNKSSGPESSEDYSKLQIKVLSLFENAMKILLEMVKDE